MKKLITLILILCSIGAIICINPAQQFIAEFDIYGNWSTAFRYGQVSPDQPPFIIGPTVSPLRGNIYFDWNVQGFRFEIREGKASPWRFQTTIIVNSNIKLIDKNNMNVSARVYAYVAPDRCLYEEINYQVPTNMGNFGTNVTVIGTRTIDGFDCIVLKDGYGDIVAVRLQDLALIMISVPYNTWEGTSFFKFFGTFNSSTWVHFTNIKVGSVDPSYFKPPDTKCVKGDWWIWPFPPMMNEFSPAKLLDRVAKMFQVDEVVKDEPVKADPPMPKLNQAITANWYYNTTFKDIGRISFEGYFGYDFEKAGFFWSVEKSSGNFPWAIETKFFIHPNRDGLELLQSGTEGGCWSYIFFQWIFTFLLPQFQLPTSSSYIGSRTINGDKVTLWAMPNSYYYTWSTIVWVRERDGVILKIELPPDVTLRDSQITFSNIEYGLEPNLYARPPVCSNLMHWNHNFNSHLNWGWCVPWC